MQTVVVTVRVRQTATVPHTEVPQPAPRQVTEVQQVPRLAGTEPVAVVSATLLRKAPVTATPEVTERHQVMEILAATATRTGQEQEGVVLTTPLTLHYLSREEGKSYVECSFLEITVKRCLFGEFRGCDLKIIKRYCFRKFWSKI